MSLDDSGKERVTLEPRPENSEQSETSETVAGRAGNIRALVSRELKRTWQSYLTSAPFNLLLGLLGMFSVWLYLSPDVEPSSRLEGIRLFMDGIFLWALVSLSVNWTSSGYRQTQSDPFREHLDFLGTLPVSAREIVAGRALVMAGSTAIMVCVFFVPGYVFLTDMREMLGPPQLLWFAATWASYALVGGGIFLFLEFSVQDSRFRFWCFMGSIIPAVGTVLLCNLVLDVYLVAGSLTLVERYGSLPALIALAVGLAGFALLGAATVRGVKQRSVKTDPIGGDPLPPSRHPARFATHVLRQGYLMGNLRASDPAREESRRETAATMSTAPPGSWASVLHLACREVRKRLIHLLGAVVAALLLGIAAAFIFGVISGSSSDGSPIAIALNVVFVLFIVALPRTSAWASGELSDVGRILPSDGHIAFLKTLPLNFGQIVAARALVSVSSVMVLLSVLLSSFYMLSGPFREEIGVGGLLLFAGFWIGCALAFEAVGIFTEVGLRGRAGFSVYMVLSTLSGGLAGGYGAEGADVVSLVIELIQSRGALPVLAVLILGGVSLGFSWLATTWRLNRKGVGS